MEEEVERLLAILLWEEEEEGASNTHTHAHTHQMLMALEDALLDRFRADDVQEHSQDLYDQGLALLLQYTQADQETDIHTHTSSPIYNRLARFVKATLGWRQKYLYTTNERKRQRVRFYGDGRHLVHVFLALVKEEEVFVNV